MPEHQKESGKQYAFPPGLVQRYRWQLRRKGILIYTFLAEHVNEKHECLLHFKEIAKGVSLTNAQTLKVLHRLEDLGVIAIDRSGEKTIYRLLWLPLDLPGAKES